MKGFCSDYSIEIDLHLTESEVISLRSKTLNGYIKRGHEANKKVGIELLIDDIGNEPYMKLEILPKGADFESTTTYRITLSYSSYLMIKDGSGVVDRPIMGTKVSIYKKAIKMDGVK